MQPSNELTRSGLPAGTDLAATQNATIMPTTGEQVQKPIRKLMVLSLKSAQEKQAAVDAKNQSDGELQDANKTIADLGEVLDQKKSKLEREWHENSINEEKIKDLEAELRAIKEQNLGMQEEIDGLRHTLALQQAESGEWQSDAKALLGIFGSAGCSSTDATNAFSRYGERLKRPAPSEVAVPHGKCTKARDVDEEEDNQRHGLDERVGTDDAEDAQAMEEGVGLDSD